MGERQKVLIVDDTPENIQVLMECLKDDYAIAAATGGEKALELAAKEPRPDIILLDVMMPGIDGYEVCERLKADAGTERIPVIFVTALTEAGDEERGLALGAVDFITKPLNPCLVKARVRNQLELKLYRDSLEELVRERTRELLETTAAKQKLESDLRVAKKLQMAMLPERSYRDAAGRYEICAHLEPALAVGGDLYDYFMLDGSRLCALVGDVSDKGVSAALFMVRASTVIRSEAARATTPGELLGRVNVELCKNNESCMFVTLVCVILDLDTGEMSIASGGHEMPLLGGPERTTEMLLVHGGPALGLHEDAVFTSMEMKLDPGDSLFLYTDGVTEAFDADGLAFSEGRLLDTIAKHAGEAPEELAKMVLWELELFTGSAPQSDDITMLALRRGSGGAPA